LMAKKILITGGAGFIGCHTTRYFASKGHEVVIIDNLSRKGTSENLDWLREGHPVTHYETDIRDFEAVTDIFNREKDFSDVIHLAAQVAVTTSVANPRDDFDINALGTFNMLEAVRHFCPHAPFIYASTNKVYGLLPHVEVVEGARRYEIKGKKGVSESEPLDFHSPYGCSKGSIYGERQFGVEDQGWMAWFIIAGILGRSVSIYGDGKQVRDVLYVHDLVKLYEKSMEQRNALSGKAYNVGGGLENSLSLLEFIEILKDQDLQLSFTFEDWRPGDQRVFISDNTKVEKELDWKPETAPDQGIRNLMSWVRENKKLLNCLLGDSNDADRD